MRLKEPVATSVRLELGIKDSLKDRADRERMSLDEFIRHILTEFIAQSEGKLSYQEIVRKLIVSEELDPIVESLKTKLVKSVE